MRAIADPASACFRVSRLWDLMNEGGFGDYGRVSRSEIGFARRALIDELGRDAFADRARGYLERLKALGYDRYILTVEWQMVRYFALRRAGYMCQADECDCGRWLEVHDLTYERLGEERLADVSVRCDRCHAREHDAVAPVRERGLIRPDFGEAVLLMTGTPPQQIEERAQ